MKLPSSGFSFGGNITDTCFARHTMHYSGQQARSQGRLGRMAMLRGKPRWIILSIARACCGSKSSWTQIGHERRGRRDERSMCSRVGWIGSDHLDGTCRTCTNSAAGIVQPSARFGIGIGTGTGTGIGIDMGMGMVRVFGCRARVGQDCTRGTRTRTGTTIATIESAKSRFVCGSRFRATLLGHIQPFATCSWPSHRGQPAHIIRHSNSARVPVEDPRGWRGESHFV